MRRSFFHLAFVALLWFGLGWAAEGRAQESLPAFTVAK